jgi:hypothetical protein
MRRVIEIQTTGVDEYLQGIGGDPWRGTSYVGLRVPTLPTSTLDTRYLMNAAAFSIGSGADARIIGWRQLVTIGFQQGTAASGETGNNIRPVEMEVTSPVWRFVDGNVSHHLRSMGPPNGQGNPIFPQGPVDQPSFKLGWSLTPAVLYQTAAGALPIYTNLTDYTPPNGGKPFGSPLYNGLNFGSLYGLSTQWRTPDAWTSLDIPIKGPDTIAWFISVCQTDPATRTALTPPRAGFVACGIPPEEAFLQNYPNAIYWRVGVSLIVEVDPLDIKVY